MHCVVYAGADVGSSDQRSHAHCRHEAACATELESNSIAHPYALATRHPEHRQMFCCNSTLLESLQLCKRHAQGLSDDPIGGLALLATWDLE